MIYQPLLLKGIRHNPEFYSGYYLYEFEFTADTFRQIERFSLLQFNKPLAIVFKISGKSKVYDFLLKALEEPPENTLYILEVADGVVLPFTIESRCRVVDGHSVQSVYKTVPSMQFYYSYYDWIMTGDLSDVNIYAVSDMVIRNYYLDTGNVIDVPNKTLGLKLNLLYLFLSAGYYVKYESKKQYPRRGVFSDFDLSRESLFHKVSGMLKLKSVDEVFYKFVYSILASTSSVRNLNMREFMIIINKYDHSLPSLWFIIFEYINRFKDDNIKRRSLSWK